MVGVEELDGVTVLVSTMVEAEGVAVTVSCHCKKSNELPERANRDDLLQRMKRV